MKGQVFEIGHYIIRGTSVKKSSRRGGVSRSSMVGFRGIVLICWSLVIRISKSLSVTDATIGGVALSITKLTFSKVSLLLRFEWGE